ncbi:hypothetical protein QBC33DRAFT_547946 [Phialemonium atrogriseum]|uniref:Uncharacterized protein n=1 Tax=Phialemonium atrogriseum TaxID=1093897 RepID=A0AAJ0BU74_9PEZI|nr:uncharacterized protein QBC33DRAFT_547946 [Phialemonium atrogriseum]KAK1764072.1 hypothetical protein QBC33DRAFT_547946 [Phialemonium atrogriseum]
MQLHEGMAAYSPPHAGGIYLICIPHLGSLPCCQNTESPSPLQLISIKGRHLTPPPLCSPTPRGPYYYQPAIPTPCRTPSAQVSRPGPYRTRRRGGARSRSTPCRGPRCRWTSGTAPSACAAARRRPSSSGISWTGCRTAWPGWASIPSAAAPAPGWRASCSGSTAWMPFLTGLMRCIRSRDEGGGCGEGGETRRTRASTRRHGSTPRW